MKQLYELQQEINRLFIAGSKFAGGDPRLAKHVPVLKKLGEKAPVFAKIASDVEALLQAEAKESAERLLAVSTLLYSVLYTQGKTTEEGTGEAAVTPQEPNVALAQVNTAYSYLQLKPVMQALTESKSGRLEVLKEAQERGLFADSRTFAYLSKGLGDKYGELADYVEQEIIPSLGTGMLPFLVQDFAFEDTMQNVRRLRLLQHFNYEGLKAIEDKVFEENLPNLQATALTSIAARGGADTEALIISLTGDKNKAVRGAAYMALAKLGTDTAIDKLYEVYSKNKKKSDTELLAAAIGSVALPRHYKAFLQTLEAHFDAFMAMDKSNQKKVGTALDNFQEELPLLKGKDYAEVYDFIAKLYTTQDFWNFQRREYGYRIVMYIREILGSFDAKKVLAFYEQHLSELPKLNNYFNPLSQYLEKAATVYGKEQLFDSFSKYLNNGLQLEHFYNVFTNGHANYYYDLAQVEVYKERIDPRWAYKFVNYIKNFNKYDYTYLHTMVMLEAIDPKREEVLEMLLFLLPKVPLDSREPYYQMLLKQETPEKYALIYEAIEKTPKNNYYAPSLYKRLIEKGFFTTFPKEYAEKLNTLAESRKEEIFEKIAREIK